MGNLNMIGIGEKIRIQRLIKNYSQEYMAWSLSISQAAYSNIERDETDVTVSRIFEIAEVLEISAFVLMPKPKYSLLLNYQLMSIVAKIKKYWRKAFPKTPQIPAKYIDGYHSDTSKLQD
jgi:transcriptional regulator with XRE-family HTH domain